MASYNSFCDWRMHAGWNSRYFRNWRYTYEQTPELPRTEEVITAACDFGIPLTFNKSDLHLLARMVEENWMRSRLICLSGKRLHDVLLAVHLAQIYKTASWITMELIECSGNNGASGFRFRH